MSAISQYDIEDNLHGDASISLKPRNFSLRMDLAIKTFRSHLSLFGGMWLSVAIPAASITYYLARYHEMRLPTALSILAVASAMLGVLVALTLTPGLIGDEIGRATLAQQYKQRGFGLMLKAILYRVLTAVGLMLFFIPGWIMWEFTANFVEDKLLKPITYSRQTKGGRRQSNLVEGGSIFVFCLILWTVIYLTCEVVMYLLFEHTIIPQALAEREGVADPDQILGDVILYEPEFLALFVFTGLLVYIIGRIAWFYNYVDSRVRNDCWDIELALVREVKRLNNRQR